MEKRFLTIRQTAKAWASERVPAAALAKAGQAVGGVLRGEVYGERSPA